MLPGVSPRFERLVIVGSVHREREQRRIRRVTVGAQHARAVLERRVLRATLSDGSRRLPLEVEDDKILFGSQDLAQVIVAVKPDEQSGAIDRTDGVELRE